MHVEAFYYRISRVKGYLIEAVGGILWHWGNWVELSKMATGSCGSSSRALIGMKQLKQKAMWGVSKSMRPSYCDASNWAAIYTAHDSRDSFLKVQVMNTGYLPGCQDPACILKQG